ncbi:hypothetical protein ACX1FC_05575 [Legionella pneumophila]
MEKRKEKRVIVGFYMEPRVWFGDGNQDTTCSEAKEVVFANDIRPEINLAFQRQGYVVLDADRTYFPTGLDKINKITMILNSFLFYFYEIFPGSQLRQLISAKDLWVWDDNLLENTDTIISNKQPFPLINSMMNIEFAKLFLSKSVGMLTTDDKSFRIPIPLENLEKCLNMMSKEKIEDFEDNMKYASMLNKATFYIESGDFGESLVLSWSICEKILSTFWANYHSTSCKSNNTTMNKDRKKILNDFTASQITETLEMAGIISNGYYKRLNKIRKKRNDYLHNLNLITQNDSNEAFLIARDMISKRLNVSLNHKGGFFFTGLNIDLI